MFFDNPTRFGKMLRQNDVPPQPSCPSYLEELQEVEPSPAPIKPEMRSRDDEKRGLS